MLALLGTFLACLKVTLAMKLLEGMVETVKMAETIEIVEIVEIVEEVEEVETVGIVKAAGILTAMDLPVSHIVIIGSQRNANRKINVLGLCASRPNTQRTANISIA